MDSIQSQCTKIKRRACHLQDGMLCACRKQSRQHGQYSAQPQRRNAVLHGRVNASGNKMCRACMLLTRPDAVHDGNKAVGF